MSRTKFESMWLQFYGLQKPPFESAWDFESPEQYFFTEKIKKKLHIIDHFLYASEPLIMITGEDGMGKTWMAQYLYRYIKASSFNETMMLDIAPAEQQRDWLFRTVAGQLNLNITASLSEAFATYLTKLASEKRNVVIVIDNIKILQNSELLEEWRRMTNIQPENRNMFTAIVLSTPREYNNLGKTGALGGRVSTRIKLESFNLDETSEYIRFRLLCANCREQLFDKKACALIYETTHGIPLRINLLCQQALMLGARQYSEKIDEKIIRDSVKQMASPEGVVVHSLEGFKGSAECFMSEQGDHLSVLLDPTLLKKIILQASSDEALCAQLDALVEKAVFLCRLQQKSEKTKMLSEIRQMLRQGLIREALMKLKEIGEEYSKKAPAVERVAC